MAFTEDQKVKIIKKLDKFLNTPCKVCQSKNWLLSEKIFALSEFEKGKLIIGGKNKVFPVFTVTCRSCGYVYFFNAIILKIIDKDE